MRDNLENHMVLEDPPGDYPLGYQHKTLINPDDERDRRLEKEYEQNLERNTVQKEQ